MGLATEFGEPLLVLLQLLLLSWERVYSWSESNSVRCIIGEDEGRRGENWMFMSLDCAYILVYVLWDFNGSSLVN